MQKDRENRDAFYDKALAFVKERGRSETGDQNRTDSLSLLNVDQEVADLWDEFELLADHHLATEPAFYSTDSKQHPIPVTNIHAPSPRKTKSMTRSAPWLSAAAIIVISFGLLLFAYRGIPQTFNIEKGDQYTLKLQDGSEIFLDSGSQITLHEGWGRRSVDLIRGAAYFSVKKNPDKPFWVDCGEAQISVLGTAFSVYRKGTHLEVVVETGKVNVSTKKAVEHPYNVDLVQEEKLTVRSDNKINKEAVVDLQAAFSWKQGILHFKKENLSAVISRMGDFYKEPIFIVNEEKRNLHISGTFKTDNIERFLQALRLSLDVEIQRGKNGSVLIY